MIDQGAKTEILVAIAKEKEVAIENYGYFHSDHEFYAVMREEVEELQEESVCIVEMMGRLWDMIRADETLNRDKLEMIREMAIDAACETIQVAAVIDKYLEGRATE